MLARALQKHGAYGLVFRQPSARIPEGRRACTPGRAVVLISEGQRDDGHAVLGPNLRPSNLPTPGPGCVLVHARLAAAGRWCDGLGNHLDHLWTAERYNLHAVVPGTGTRRDGKGRERLLESAERFDRPTSNIQVVTLG